MKLRRGTAILLVLWLGFAAFGVAQTDYKPKFPGDPARSDSEAQALGYMRTVLRAQRQYKKKYDKYAPSLDSLVHTGSFTRRMAATDRGDYTVGFHSKNKKKKDEEGFELTLTPKQLDAQHRSFYADEDGVIHAEEDKAAGENSPVVK
jgi:type II secretory pathway pseudopilin PulG